MAVKEVLFAVLLLTLVPLAGCVGGGSGSGGPTDAAPSNASGRADGSPDGDAGGGVPADGAQAPEWSMLDWFKFKAEGRWTTNSTYTAIVHAKTDDGYVVATDTREQAVYEKFWNDPFLGEMTRDLDPVDDRLPEQVFNWPLQDGKTWTTQNASGGTWEMSVDRRQVQTHAGEMTGFRIKGRSADNWTVFVTYTPQMDWFSNWMLHNATGEMLINVDMVGMGSNYTGEMFVGSGEIRADDEWRDTTQNPHVVSVEVGEDVTDLHYFVFTGSLVGSHVTVIGPEGNVTNHGPTPNGAAGVPLQAVERNVRDPAAGTWRFVIEFVGYPDVTWGRAYLRVATIQLETMSHG